MYPFGRLFRPPAHSLPSARARSSNVIIASSSPASALQSSMLPCVQFSRLSTVHMKFQSKVETCRELNTRKHRAFERRRWTSGGYDHVTAKCHSRRKVMGKRPEKAIERLPPLTPSESHGPRGDQAWSTTAWLRVTREQSGTLQRGNGPGENSSSTLNT